jgi:hypothetical protein
MAMSDLKSNKSLQFIVGAGVLYVAYIVLIREGWLAWMLSDPEEAEAFGDSSQLLLAIVSACVSFTQLIGLLTIGVVCNVIPHASAFMDFVGKQLRLSIQKLKAGADKNKADWDWRPLAAIALSYALWTGGQIQDMWSLLLDAIPHRIENAESKPEFLIFSSDSASATDGQLSVINSLLVEDMLESEGVERRSYDSEQTASNAEPWVAQAMEAAPDDKNTMIMLYKNGRATIDEIPSSIEEMQEVIGAW